MAVVWLFLFSWVNFPFAIWQEGIRSLVPLGIILTICVLSYFAKKPKLLLFAIITPAMLVVTYFTILPTVRYFKGSPTFVYCGCEYYNFDPVRMVYVEAWFNDCDFYGYYTYSTDVNNAITNFWISALGNPIDVIPDNADIEEFIYP